MKDKDELRRTLQRINGRGYGAYKDIEGEYGFDRYRLCIDHVQGDPFASPRRVRVQLDRDVAGFPQDTQE